MGHTPVRFKKSAVGVVKQLYCYSEPGEHHHDSTDGKDLPTLDPNTIFSCAKSLCFQSLVWHWYKIKTL